MAPRPRLVATPRPSGSSWRGRARTSNIRLQRPTFCRLNYPPKAVVTRTTLRSSSVDQLDAIPERVIDVTATHAGDLGIEASGVPGRPQRCHQAVEILDDQCRVGLGRRTKIALHPEMNLHGPVGEPAPTPDGQPLRLGPALETEQSLVEGGGHFLTPCGHGELDMVDRRDPVTHVGHDTRRLAVGHSLPLTCATTWDP